MDDGQVLYSVTTSWGEEVLLTLYNPVFEFGSSLAAEENNGSLAVYSTVNDFSYLIAAFPVGEWRYIRKLDDCQVLKDEK